MTRARMPRQHEVAAARRDPRLVRASIERRTDDGWRSRGVCRRHDPETFFPAPNEPPDAALALCRSCDVQGPCLAWALDAGDCHGVWGATTPRERRAMAVVWQGEPMPDLVVVPRHAAEVGGVSGAGKVPVQRLPLAEDSLDHVMGVAS